jgi:hypothetical protein
MTSLSLCGSDLLNTDEQQMITAFLDSHGTVGGGL